MQMYEIVVCFCVFLTVFYVIIFLQCAEAMADIFSCICGDFPSPWEFVQTSRSQQ